MKKCLGEESYNPVGFRFDSLICYMLTSIGTSESKTPNMPLYFKRCNFKLMSDTASQHQETVKVNMLYKEIFLLYSSFGQITVSFGSLHCRSDADCNFSTITRTLLDNVQMYLTNPVS